MVTRTNEQALEAVIERQLTGTCLKALKSDSFEGENEYTESDMNGFSESETCQMFDKDEYRLLVVANELELYKLLANDSAFKAAMQQSLRQIVDG